MIVELIYDADCPNLVGARTQLIKAFTQTGVPAKWKEWERSSPGTPDYARAYGSPTILVDGKDIDGVAPNAGTRSCRVYSDARGNMSRTPAVEAICFALFGAGSEKKPAAARWQVLVASLPAIGTALLPKLTCPLCFPAYAAILGALGIEFLDYTPYLLPLTAIFLAVAITVLALQARRSGNYVPLALGIVVSLVVLCAKFGLDSDWLVTSGIVMLVVAIFLGNRKKSNAASSCPACAVGETDRRIEAH